MGLFTKRQKEKFISDLEEKFISDLEVCQVFFDSWWDNHAKPALILAGEESADFAQAMALGVFVGESARDKASDLGGTTGPEILGFNIGLAGGPIARKKLMDVILAVAAGASVPVWAGGFIEAFINILLGALQKPDKEG